MRAPKLLHRIIAMFSTNVGKIIQLYQCVSFDNPGCFKIQLRISNTC